MIHFLREQWEAIKLKTTTTNANANAKMNVLNNVPLTFEEEDSDCRVCVTCRFTYPLFKFYDREHWGNQCNECRDEMDSCGRTMGDYRRVALLHKYKLGDVTEWDDTYFATHITAGDGVIIRDKVQPTVWKNSKYLNVAEKTKSGYKSRRNCSCCIKKTTRRCERGCGAFTCADHECTNKWCIILNF